MKKNPNHESKENNIFECEADKLFFGNMSVVMRHNLIVI